MELAAQFAVPPVVTLDDIATQAEVATGMMSSIRSSMLAPRTAKQEPTFSAEDLAVMCGQTGGRGWVNHQMTIRSDLPTGQLSESGRKRHFGLTDARVWVREFRKGLLRPAGAEAVTITIANFKGGTTKTTTAMTLAQGLSVLGHKVLVIDTDPQASLTTLFGILPDVEVQDSETMMALVDGSQKSVRPLIRKTYWDGLDLVPASTSLFAAEFMLPSMQSKNPKFEFWSVLDLGIDDVRADYDVIVIDSPPALSYVTINSLFAANGIIIPLPPDTLDFASSAQFWDLFSSLTTDLLKERGSTKTFDFIDVLLSRVSKSMTTDVVRQWISATYKEKVLPLEIPRTATTSLKSAEFGTVYDADPEDSKDRTYKRAREAYDQFVEHIERQVMHAWVRQLAAAPAAQLASV
ncbi:AAA family ATPase [Variovorax ginsengisoli]|uniref:AAA family ATPase n=1 Tax=Variovorax ginsengisoli TaxID=363844 RepID=A0ABT8SEZ4_9BURK|nr:AAA family ATPase [Variovorax ginsengisoli]MDN8618320.1 AAA family ATPase [Variovorax ginsengisoli]MDO1537490.1 AAA family ATPase [Variovorax ginsengisoli]